MIEQEYLYKVAMEQGILLKEKQLEQFEIYARLLVEWNHKFNLTAIVQPKEIVIKHFLDSLLLAKHVQIEARARVADIGTGAGFPGIPLKIFRPDIALTLVDSLNKRILFLREVLQELSLEGEAIHMRAEDGGKNAAYREKYDLVTARAVAHLRELSEYCLPYVKVGGMFVPLKGGQMEQESRESGNAIRICGGKIEKMTLYQLPDHSSRSLILIKKISQTPPKYPRNRGQMLKKWL